MRAHRTLRIALLGAIAVLAALLPAGATTAAIPAGSPGVSIIAQNGFGSRDNSYAWSMDYFKGKLYVGTGRDELCVENETLEFYYPLLSEYMTNPSPGVRCAANPFNMPLQAEIWQFTPGTHTWARVYQSPTIDNPLARGKQVARDLAYRGMVTYHNPQGKAALFAAAVTPDEYLPPLRTSHPPVLLRTYDGVHWTTLNLPPVIVHFPTGNFRPMGYRSLVVFHNRLFVTVTPDLTGDGALFEVKQPWSQHPYLRQVSPRYLDIFEVSTFRNALYVGTGNVKNGYGVWKWRGRGRFVPVVTGGAGRGHDITSVVSMKVYRDRLYVGASGWYNQNTVPSSEMIRISPRGQWTLVVGNPRMLRSGLTVYPTSGLGDGFFNLFSAHFWRMAVQGGGLYATTNDWSYLVQTNKEWAWLQSLLAGELGFDLWATCDGNDWFAITRDAFSGNEYNFGGRTLQPDGPNGTNLYIGTANQSQGTTIFDDAGQACSSLVNTARPRALMSDARTRGTLLSWQAATRAQRYVIYRAPYVPITLSLKAPPTLPSGFHFEDQFPILTTPGAPGSVSVNLSAPGQFVPVATTTSPYYVDPSHGRYVYQVVARSASGSVSGPSNMEVVPAQRPPATFGALSQALGAPAASVAGVHSGGGGAATRQARLIAAARAAWRAGDHSGALTDLARLRATAGDNDALALLAARVQRNLQYAGVGDGASTGGGT